MTISRAAVCGLFLGFLLLWLPSGTGAQGNIDCRAAVDNVFKKANDLSIKDNVLNDELASLPAKCKVKESDSVLRFPRYRDQIKAQQEEEDGSSRRTEKTANRYNRASPSDPGGGTPPGKAAVSPKDETVDKFLHDCAGKPVKDANCEKLRKDFVEILKEDLRRLGSTTKRAYLPRIVRMFKSDEAELRIAAADAIGMIGPQDSDVEVLAPLTNDPVPDVRHAVSNMLRQGKGNALTLLKERTIPMRTGRTPDKPADAAKFSLPVAPDSTYLFDSSDAAIGRLSYVAKDKSDPASFFKAKAKKSPFKLEEFQEKYRYQIQDEQEALNQVQEVAAKQMENMKPPDPTNVQALTEYMEKVQAVQMGRTSKMLLDSYQPTLFGTPTVYVLEERQIGQRSYPTRYVVLYQEQALKKPGYRLSWMTVPDDTIKTAQAASIAEEKEELARSKENEVLKKRGEALEDLVKKKDEQEKKNFKKGQADLEKELGF
jgi:HEAT repeat protein